MSTKTPEQEELRNKVRRAVVKAQYGTIGELTDSLTQLIEQEVTKARVEEWKFYQGILSDHDLRELDRQTLNTMRMHVTDLEFSLSQKAGDDRAA